MAKEKSKRNKTIVLTEDEKIKFEKDIRTNYKMNSVINNDAFNVISDIPDNSVDLLFTDPPYNLSKMYGSTKFNATKLQEYLDWSEKWIKLALPKLKNDASIYICNDWRASALQLVLDKYFYIQNRITFERDKGRGSKTNWKNSSEDIWFCTMSKDKYYFNAEVVKVKKRIIAPYVDKEGKPKDWEETKDGKFRMTSPSNLWTDITIPFWSMSENTEHSTQKPEKLAAKIILASSEPNDVVLDLFGGSGTAAVAAKKLGRRYILIEKEKEYSLVSAKRISECKEGDRIQGYEKGIFLSRNI